MCHHNLATAATSSPILRSDFRRLKKHCITQRLLVVGFKLLSTFLLLLLLTLLTQNTDFHNSNVRNKCQKDCQGESPLTTALRKE